MTGLKRKATAFFKKRKLLLRSLANAGIRADSDLAELYVLSRLVQAADRVRVENAATQGSKRVFQVATSPSPDWTHGSRFVAVSPTGAKYALRTGLEVQTSDGGTVELDIVVVATSTLAGASKVPSSACRFASEVKLHARSLSASVANEVLGKGVRVFSFPVPLLGNSSTVRAYCLVASNGLSANAAQALTGGGIGHCDLGPALEALARSVTKELQID